jgi:hypothetical protein
MTSFKRAAGVVAVAALLASSTAYAADVSAPLPAGNPAGTHEAALLALGPIFWIGLAAIALGVGVAASNNGNKGTTTSTSTGTNG